MDVITQRRCLTALAGSLLLGAIGAGAWSLSSLPVPQPVAGSGSRPIASPLQASGETEGANYDASMLSLKLRQPLTDPPPPRPRPTPKPVVKPQPKPPQAPKLNFTLLATIIDSQRSLAVIADPSGNLDYKSVGESLTLSPSGVSIVRIESDQVTLAHNGRESTLLVDKKRRGGGAGARQRNTRGRVNR
tara:strand:+ start:1014469 stop:1015035 length:567 start_codon:yes stop_codon:yes gene_type:complete